MYFSFPYLLKSTSYARMLWSYFSSKIQAACITHKLYHYTHSKYFFSLIPTFKLQNPGLQEVLWVENDNRLVAGIPFA